MNVDEIIKQVTRDVDNSPENGDIVAWINRALADLTPIAKKEKMLLLDATNQIPIDCFEIKHIFVNDRFLNKLDIEDNNGIGYKVWGNAITLQNITGPIQLYYYRTLAKVFYNTDIPEIEEPYHDLLVYYAIGHLQFKDEDYEDRADMLQQRYMPRKAEYKAFIDRRNKKSSVKSKVKW